MTDERLEGDLEGSGERPAAAGADVEALQKELAQLRQQVDEQQDAAKARQHRGRGWAVGLLVVLGVILLAVANVTVWLRSVVLDSDTWAITVGPLTQNETVANAVSFYVVDSLFELVDLEQAIGEVLPSEYSFLGGPLTSVVQNLAQDTATKLIQSDQFNTVWVALNRTAHRAIMAVLRGNGDLLYLREGQLTIDLSDIFDSVADALGLGRLPVLQNVQTRFVLLESWQVAVVQQVLGVIDTVGVVVPLLAFGFLLLAWLISLWRRRTLMWIGIGTAVAMALSLIGFALAQPLVLVNIVDPFVRLLAGEILGVLARGLYIQTVAILVIGLLVVAGTALAGPSPRAVAIRTGARESWDKLLNR